MTISCVCGALIVDQGDQLPPKAYVITDRDWFRVLDACDAAIAKGCPDRAMAVRQIVIQAMRLA